MESIVDIIYSCVVVRKYQHYSKWVLLLHNINNARFNGYITCTWGYIHMQLTHMAVS